MLDNILELSVDPANNSTVVTESYRRYDESANRSLYIGDDHTLQQRNQMTLNRSFPTVVGNFKGVAKSVLKFTQDIVVDGNDGVASITAPALVTINFSLPVGITPAQAIHFRQRAIAALDDDDLMSRFSETLEV